MKEGGKKGDYREGEEEIHRKRCRWREMEKEGDIWRNMIGEGTRQTD